MALCRNSNEEAHCECCLRSASSQHFRSGFGVPDPFTQFSEEAPGSNPESHIALDIVALWGGHWHTGQSIVATFSLTVLAGDKLCCLCLLLLLQKHTGKLVRNATAEDWFIKYLGAIWGLKAKLAYFPNIVCIRCVKKWGGDPEKTSINTNGSGKELACDAT